MQDEFGRTVIFHGVNAVFKSKPFIPKQDSFDPFVSLSEKDFEDLEKWGFNLMRLGILWEGFEVEEQVYNNTLLEEFEKIINHLGERGIYTFVDSH